jgi:hypothetical protein
MGDAQRVGEPQPPADELSVHPDFGVVIDAVEFDRRDLVREVGGRRFFGRERPLAELRTAIAGSAPVGVFGLRKVGKTSLLMETQRRASEWGDVVAYTGLDGETVVVVGSRNEADTFPNGFFQAWKLNSNTGRRAETADENHAGGLPGTPTCREVPRLRAA